MHALRAALSKSRRALAFAALFSFVSNLLLLTTSIYMMQVYDRALTTRSYDTLLYLTLLALVAVLTLGLVEIARSRILLRVSAYLERSIAPTAFKRALGNALEGSRYRSEIVRDLREVRMFLTGSGMLAIFDFPWAPLFLATIFLLNPILGVFSAASMLVLFGMTAINDWLMRPRLSHSNELGVAAMQDLEACIRNAEIVDALGMYADAARRWLAKNETSLGLQVQASSVAATVTGLSKFCRVSVQILILGIGAALVMTDELSAGGMIAASILLGRALAPLDMAIGTWRQMVSARAAYRRIDKCLSEPERRPAGMPLPPPLGVLALEQVGYVAPGGRQILSDVSFDLEVGDTLAILGPSAAGKTTLGRLLVGILPPSSGNVRLDGADLFPRDRNALGRHIGYLPQEVTLFAGTVAENIARLREFELDEVIEAAQRANVHDMILRLPQGYDTEIGERGLSGGQRQRVALARALFGRPSLVVLDEPNANLDSEGDAGLGHALSELRRQGVTVVFITHRPGLIAYADKLVLMRDGRAEAFGPREQVMRRLKLHAVPAEPVRRLSGERV